MSIVKPLEQLGHILGQIADGFHPFAALFNLPLFPPKGHVPVGRAGDNHLAQQNENDRVVFLAKKEEPS